tara:strand:+ start:598 stop:903 length:306 start_codon:yes stop_codon:yes gene_type:complete
MNEFKSDMKRALCSVIDDLNDYVPKKIDPYCSYSACDDGFYVSTTDIDEYDGVVPFNDVINKFIESNSNDKGVCLVAANEFIKRLTGAIELLEQAKLKSNT